MADHGRQRQRHGPTKNLVEGVGGLIVGAAVAILIGELLKKRPRDKQRAEPASIDGPDVEMQRQA